MPLETALKLFLIIAALGVLVYLIVRIIRLHFVVVPEEERLVVYRVGRFNRVAGPGWILLFERWESIHHRLDVRDRNVTVTANGLMIYGVPFGYTLSFWRHIDPREAMNEYSRRRDAAQDSRLADYADSPEQFFTRVAMYNDEEYRQQTAVKLREALKEVLDQIQADDPTPWNEGEFAKKLLPILPGIPPNEQFMTRLKAQLIEMLPMIGVFFNPLHPITVMSINLGDDITGSFKRGRIQTLLRENFPTLSEQVLLQAISSIEGIEQPERRIHFDGNGANTSSVEMRDDEDSMRYKFYPGGSTPATNQSGARKPLAPPPAVAPASPAGDEPPFGRDDLNVLKQVPRASSRARAAGAP